jgi:hypothetical protein
VGKQDRHGNQHAELAEGVPSRRYAVPPRGANLMATHSTSWTGPQSHLDLHERAVKHSLKAKLEVDYEGTLVAASPGL